MNNWFAGIVDRAVRTALQTLLGYLSAAQLINQVEWIPALSATGFAVVLSLLTSVVGAPSFGERWEFQVAERAVKTFAQTILAGIGAAWLFEQVDWKTALSTAALAAAYSMVTSVLATRGGPIDTHGQTDLTSPPARGAHLEEV